MVGIKERAEGSGVSIVGTLEPVLWLVAAGILVGGGLRAVFQPRVWWRPLYVAAAAAVVLPWLMFWQPPILVGIAADGLLVAALVWSVRAGRPAPAARDRRDAAPAQRVAV